MESAVKREIPMKEKKVAQLKGMKELLDKEGIKYESLNNGICLRIGEYDFFPTTLTYIHRPTQLRGKGVLDLIKLVKPEVKAMESAGEKKLAEIINKYTQKIFAYGVTPIDLKNVVKEIKSHYYAKSEVERIISNLTTNNNFNQGTTYFDVLEDLKTELNKLGER